MLRARGSGLGKGSGLGLGLNGCELPASLRPSCISLYLPMSPFISIYLPVSACELEAELECLLHEGGRPGLGLGVRARARARASLLHGGV